MGRAHFPGSGFAHPTPVRQRGAVHCQLWATIETTPLSNESILFSGLRAQSSNRTVTTFRPPCTSPFHLCHLSSNLIRPRWYARHCVATCSGTGRFSRRRPLSRCSAASTRRPLRTSCAASAWALASFRPPAASSRALGIWIPPFAASFRHKPDRRNDVTCALRRGACGSMSSTRARRAVKDRYSAAQRRVHRSPRLRPEPSVNR